MSGCERCHCISKTFATCQCRPCVARGLKQRREGGTICRRGSPNTQQTVTAPRTREMWRGLKNFYFFPLQEQCQRPLRPERGDPRASALLYAATVARVVSSEPPYNNHHWFSSVLVFAFIYFGAAILLM